MDKKFQKRRMGDLKRWTDHLSKLAQDMESGGRLSLDQIESVRLILNTLHEGKKGRPGKRERHILRAANRLMGIAAGAPADPRFLETERRAWSEVTSIWKVLEGEMRPVDRQAVKDTIGYQE